LPAVAQLNPALNPIIALDRDGAREMARASTKRWRQGAPLSPLNGVPSDDPERQARAKAFQRGLRERDSAEFIDDEGVELAGPDEARALAVINAGEALRDLSPSSGLLLNGGCG
jgi:hypothetical protein